MYEYYIKGMSMLGQPNQQDFVAEFKELLEDKSLEEVIDVLHTGLRLMRMPYIVSYCFAYKTARKHALRVKENGCPRSRRNCIASGSNCCCKKH